MELILILLLSAAIKWMFGFVVFWWPVIAAWGIALLVAAPVRFWRSIGRGIAMCGSAAFIVWCGFLIGVIAIEVGGSMVDDLRGLSGAPVADTTIATWMGPLREATPAPYIRQEPSSRATMGKKMTPEMQRAFRERRLDGPVM